MDVDSSYDFSNISGKLCNLLDVKDFNKFQVNALIDELNSKPSKGGVFIRTDVSIKVL